MENDYRALISHADVKKTWKERLTAKLQWRLHHLSIFSRISPICSMEWALNYPTIAAGPKTDAKAWTVNGFQNLCKTFWKHPRNRKTQKVKERPKTGIRKKLRHIAPPNSNKNGIKWLPISIHNTFILSLHNFVQKWANQPQTYSKLLIEHTQSKNWSRFHHPTVRTKRPFQRQS